MKKYLILIAIFAALSLTCVYAQAPKPAAEVTFTFTRLTGNATNQYAIWVEDASGKYIKTIYATRYTASGGYERRPSSIPVWVKQSGLSALNETQVDALTGVTPRTGNVIYNWDGTDSKGAAVPNGDYVIVLEATLRWESQVYYRAPIRLGRAAAATVSVEYKGESDADRAMISGVKVRSLR